MAATSVGISSSSRARPTVAEKYDYLYSEKELEEIARAAGALTRVRKSVSSGLDALRKFLLKRLLEDLL
jgi:hypothetical protein